MQTERWGSERDGQLSKEAMRRRLQERRYGVSRYVCPPGSDFLLCRILQKR